MDKKFALNNLQESFDKLKLVLSHTENKIKRADEKKEAFDRNLIYAECYGMLAGRIETHLMLGERVINILNNPEDDLIYMNLFNQSQQ